MQMYESCVKMADMPAAEVSNVIGECYENDI